MPPAVAVRPARPRSSSPVAHLLALSAILVSASTLRAANPPSIAAIRPAGAPRGVPTEITVNGANLRGAVRWIAPYAAVVEQPEGPNSNPGELKFRLLVPPDAPVGIASVRILVDGGLSNPVLFDVGQTPQVFETEPNNRFEQAAEVPFPVVVEGEAAGNDVDHFRFPGRKGQKILIDARCARVGSGLDPAIRLTTANRGFVASADDTPGLFTDARIIAELPEDGDYVVQISDSKYAGANRPIYRLAITSAPAAGEIHPLGGRAGETVGFEVRGGTLPADVVKTFAATVPPSDPSGLGEFLPRVDGAALGLVGPTDSPSDLEPRLPLVLGALPEVREPAEPGAEPLRVLAPVVVNGRLGAPGETDVFRVVVNPGTTYRFQVDAAILGSAMDGVLTVKKPSGEQLARGDDFTAPATGRGWLAANQTTSDPVADLAIPADVAEVIVEVTDLGRRGGVGFPYRLVVAPVPPAVEVHPAAAQVGIPRGGSVSIPLTVARLGDNSPLELTLDNPPPGLALRPSRVATGQATGVLTLEAAPDAVVEPTPLAVSAKLPSGATVPLTFVHVYARQGNIPSRQGLQTGLPAVAVAEAPVRFAAPAEIQAPLGGTVSIPVSLSRGEGAAVELNVEPMPLPPGVASPAVKIAADAAEAAVAVAVNPPAPRERFTLAWTAKAKIGDDEHVLTIPGVTLDVVPGAKLALGEAAVEVVAGQTRELAGTVERLPGFALPVTVRVEGLPAGLKADPVEVPADRTAFTLKIEAAPDAAAAVAKPNLIPAYKANNQDVNGDPVPLDLTAKRPE